MRALEVAGAAIDAGPTVFTMRWVFDEIFAACGTSLAEHLTLQPVDVLARHLGVTKIDDDVHRLAFSITGLAMQMFISRDVIDAVRPQLIATPRAIDLWASRLVDFAEAMVAVERNRRQCLVPLKKTKP